ncbi:MAG: protein kinase [Clostridium sp.]|nr:protein kinase [Clostridium sp.]
MQNEIIGNSYKYIIDEAYGINKDGFIAKGTESIVYKGLKTKTERGLQFSCVLKFKPKRIRVYDKEINRLQVFKTEEWKIFEELRECRSIVRIDDIIEDLGEFRLPCAHIEGGVISNDRFFCVVEEFIDGWNLDEFCQEEYWKLRRIEPLANGLQKEIQYKDFTEDEKKKVRASYIYENVLKYQNQILLFMINLCEIMEFVTEQKNILHLDIKPENIMVTRHGKELVLIDFGRSKKITKAAPFVRLELSEVDYNTNETMDKLYQYGAIGFAAPECYNWAADGSKFPFTTVNEQGKVSVESDIFSLGATFWECLNIFELVTQKSQFSEDAHDFYRDYFLNDDAYCNRDLSLTSTAYHKKLETIIKKCTRSRNKRLSSSDKYYHSYRELRRDLEDAKDSVPTIVKEENVKVRTAFGLCGTMLSLFVIFLIIYGLYNLSAFHIAQRKWDSIIVSYNETQLYRLEEIANDLIATAPINQKNDTYEKIAAFTYRDNTISEYEAEMLVALLQRLDNNSHLSEYVDEIMQNADTRRFKEVSTQIVKLGRVSSSIGFELAEAIVNVEVGKTGIVDAYKTLQIYQDSMEFKNAVMKLKNVLDSDEYIRIISESEGMTRQQVQAFFKSFTLQEDEL